MKNQNLNSLELVCKKCNGVRTKISLDTLPSEVQFQFKAIQKANPELKQLVLCEKCNEISLVSNLVKF